MQLLPEWKEILRRAWSVRLMLLAGILTGIEFILPAFAAALPHNVFTILSFLSVSAALVARLLAQRQ